MPVKVSDGCLRGVEQQRQDPIVLLGQMHVEQRGQGPAGLPAAAEYRAATATVAARSVSDCDMAPSLSSCIA